MWHQLEPRPKDMLKLRCEFSADERLFKVGKIYDGVWERRINDEDGSVRVAKRYSPIDENGESYGTYHEPWLKFSIIEGSAEPPKE